jgi:hypothetical protein
MGRRNDTSFKLRSPIGSKVSRRYCTAHNQTGKGGNHTSNEVVTTTTMMIGASMAEVITEGRERGEEKQRCSY